MIHICKHQTSPMWHQKQVSVSRLAESSEKNRGQLVSISGQVECTIQRPRSTAKQAIFRVHLPRRFSGCGNTITGRSLRAPTPVARTLAHESAEPPGWLRPSFRHQFRSTVILQNWWTNTQVLNLQLRFPRNETSWTNTVYTGWSPQKG